MDDIVFWRPDPLVYRTDRFSYRFLTLPDPVRNMGIHVMAGKGSGKSRLLGRMVAWLDFLRGVPTVIYDAHGPSIDNFLDRLIRLPGEVQKRLWPRVHYVDMSGSSGTVVPFPLYYRLDNEGLYTISQRYLDVVRKGDLYLQAAPIEGWNSLWIFGSYSAMILAASGYQITEAEHLLRNPKAWSGRFTTAINAYPEVRPAVEFFTHRYLQWSEEMQMRRSASFLNKIAIFNLNPPMKAMFGADQPGIDWHEVVRKGLTVLLDFRHDRDLAQRQFKMMWAFYFLLEFIKSRGAGRHKPISLIIDELTAMFPLESLATKQLAADLDEFNNVIARNYSVWPTIAHQEPWQVDERTLKGLMTMGTQIIGATGDMDGALALARHLFRVDPYKVKRYEAVYTSYQGAAWAIDRRPVEFSIEEQQYLKAYEIKEQSRFRFLVRPAAAEGTVHNVLYPVSIAGFDANCYVQDDLVAEARAVLSRRTGVAIDKTLETIQARLEVKKKTAVKRPRLGTETTESA